MNIVALQYKSMFFLDSEKSPRFKKKAIDKAINSAINDIVLDRYDNIRKKQKEYAFQTAQRLRDELYSIVKEAPALTVASDIIALTQITDYWLLLAMRVDISGKVINTIPLTYDELNIVEIDPFVRPSIVYPERVYRIESSEGVKIVFGDTGSLVSGHAYYLMKPAKVNIGTEISDTVTEILSETKIIAYVDSAYDLYAVGGGIIGSGTLAEEEEFTVPVDPVKYIKLTSGIVFKDYTDTDLPDMLHEEIARKAAAILSGNVENYNREKSLEKDIHNNDQ
jgi:hypothetical protein